MYKSEGNILQAKGSQVSLPKDCHVHFLRRQILILKITSSHGKEMKKFWLTDLMCASW